jgi:hypothetical protein
MTNNTCAIHIVPFTQKRHRRRRFRMLGALPLLTASAVVLAACGSGNSASEASSVAVTTVVPTTSAGTLPSTTVTPDTSAATPSTTVPSGPFRSALYGYEVTGAHWSGTSAKVAWDGTGGPGSDEPVVDLLDGPGLEQAFAFGVPTTATLDEYVAAQRAVKEPDHPCPEGPEATAPITIGGEPAVLDEMHCPPDGSGVFVLAAFVVHNGWANNFVTFARSGSEVEMRVWFNSFLESITLAA